MVDSDEMPFFAKAKMVVFSRSVSLNCQLMVTVIVGLGPGGLDFWDISSWTGILLRGCPIWIPNHQPTQAKKIYHELIIYLPFLTCPLKKSNIFQGSWKGYHHGDPRIAPKAPAICCGPKVTFCRHRFSGPRQWLEKAQVQHRFFLSLQKNWHQNPNLFPRHFCCSDFFHISEAS